MGQKVRPTGFRVGIMTDWLSSWYANKQDFAELLVEDQKVRKYVKKKYPRSGISKIRIERTREKVVVHIHSAKVGMIIGKKGAEIDKLTHNLESLTHRRIEVKTYEVPRPEIDAQLVSEDIAEQLEKRASFRRTIKRSIDLSMENGAKGVRIQLSGRLGGSEMARMESSMAGSIPLSTLRAASRVRIFRSIDAAREYRRQSVDEYRRLLEQGRAGIAATRRRRRPPWPTPQSARPAARISRLRLSDFARRTERWR